MEKIIFIITLLTAALKASNATHEKESLKV